MRSTKLLLSMLSLSLVFALPALAAQGGKNAAQDVQGGKFIVGAPGDGVLMYNACNNNQSLVWAPGYTEVNYQVNGNNVSVHVLFHNDGSDTTSSSPYRLNLEANQTFNAVASTYDVPFHSVWSGDAGTFTMDGTLRFGPSDSNGKPFSNILWDANHPLNLACTQ